jgi:Na+-transporting methylmalonyl-CoA/oxaloacetate decarboxylase gamma subunit
MDILFLVLLIFSVYVISGAVSRAEQRRITEKYIRGDYCPPHRWARKEQPGSDDSYLVCDKCSRLPVTDGESV